MSSVVKFENVSVRRGRSLILDDVTWQVEEGDRWVILGPNGAGKTTLMQLAATQLHPTTGRVEILGEQLGRVDVFELRPRIGLASAALADRLPRGESVLNVVVTASYGITGRWRETYEDVDTERALDILAAFDVAHLADRTFGTLSEGERKRVQIARSLMTDPEILFLDEPGAGLDLGGRELVVAALAELAHDLASPVLVLITHHVEDIPTGFTHAMTMRDGKVIAQGRLEEVMQQETIEQTFGLPVVLQHQDGRYQAWSPVR